MAADPGLDAENCTKGLWPLALVMSTSITSLYGFLPHLPAHFHIFAGSVAVFFATQLLAGPVLKVVSPKTWNGFRAKNKQEWGTRVACEWKLSGGGTTMWTRRKTLHDKIPHLTNPYGPCALAFLHVFSYTTLPPHHPSRPLRLRLSLAEA